MEIMQMTFVAHEVLHWIVPHFDDYGSTIGEQDEKGTQKSESIDQIPFKVYQ